MPAPLSLNSRTVALPKPLNPAAVSIGLCKAQVSFELLEHASLEIENELGNKWFLTVGYHYLHAIHLESSESINAVPNGFLSDGRQKFAPADPNFGFALIAEATGWSIYNSGSVGLRKEFGENFSVLANYVYGKSIDIATENQLQDEPQDYLAPQLDRAVGDNDVRHRLVLTLMESLQKHGSPLCGMFRSRSSTLYRARSTTASWLVPTSTAMASRSMIASAILGAIPIAGLPTTTQIFAFKSD